MTAARLYRWGFGLFSTVAFLEVLDLLLPLEWQRLVAERLFGVCIDFVSMPWERRLASALLKGDAVILMAAAWSTGYRLAARRRIIGTIAVWIAVAGAMVYLRVQYWGPSAIDQLALVLLLSVPACLSGLCWSAWQAYSRLHADARSGLRGSKWADTCLIVSLPCLMVWALIGIQQGCPLPAGLWMAMHGTEWWVLRVVLVVACASLAGLSVYKREPGRWLAVAAAVMALGLVLMFARSPTWPAPPR